MIRIFAIYILIAITAAGCSMLPGTGPFTFILDPPGEQENWYQLIDVDERQSPLSCIARKAAFQRFLNTRLRPNPLSVLETR